MAEPWKVERLRRLILALRADRGVAILKTLRSQSARRSTALVIALLSIAVPVAADDEPTVELVSALPEGISEAVQAVLDPQGYAVHYEGALLAEFWMRPELPLAGEAEGIFGIEMGAVTGSALVGVARFPATWIDYRDTELEAGLYTMRYWIQPADGDHMGVSQYRDFLLMSPADLDTDPDQTFEQEALLELSGKASGRVHPAVIAVFPVWDEIDGPAQMLRNEIDQWTLAVRLSDRILGLVVIGQGELP
jgi:hypothetical protein